MYLINENKGKVGKIINVCWSFAIVMMILMTTLLNIKNPDKMNIFGYHFGVVGSESMEPTLKKYDIIFYVDGDFNELKERDIVVFLYNGSSKEMQGKLIIHRISRITDDGIIYTKGDNPNVCEDRIPLTKENYVGLYVWDYYFLGIAKFREKEFLKIFLLVLAFLLLSLLVNFNKKKIIIIKYY